VTRRQGKYKRVFYTGNALSTPEMSFTYDPNYPRLATMTDTTGTTSYTYYPVNDGDGLLGDGMLASIDGPLADDTLTCSYDVLGRVAGRSLGAAGTTNVTGFGFNDTLGRLKTVTDPLGEFTRSYQGVTGRVESVQRTAGMKTFYSWEPTGERRLTGIRYEDPVTNPIAQFGHGYLLPNNMDDPTGQIRQWMQWHRGINGVPGTNGQRWDLRYDAVDQLTEAAKGSVVDGAMETSLGYGYGYDPAGNRTQVLANGTAQEFTVNGKNQFTTTGTAQSAPVRFAGTVSANSTVTLAGQPATGTAGSLSWEKTLTLATGTHSLVLLAQRCPRFPEKK